MYLKRIELEGFKSFADRTVIPVERGLTGIVGPNGCGKSNVVDALMWVMGERSAKSLRADSMDDVIFKGAEGRASAPYAMVEIILGDDDGDVAETGGEVAVGRRLFRTGEAEFLLNGRKVRRKDVHDLLLDSGLGVRGYMVLAQGKIDAVLAANPTERRSVFEEAAGISRYKERKKETERKLDHVGNDLVRVEDILDEVQKNVRSLRIQAGKAQRFLEMRDRYRELRVRVALVESGHYLEEEKNLQSQVERLESQLAKFRDERKTAEQQMNSLNDEETVLRESFDRLRQEASSNKENTARLEGHIHGLDAQSAEIAKRQEEDQVRLVELKETGEGASAEVVELKASEAKAQQEKEEAARLLDEAEAAHTQARQVHKDLQVALEDLRAEILDALAERTRCNNRLAEAAKGRSEAAGSLKSVNRRLEELAPALEILQEEAANQTQALVIASDQARTSEGQLHILTDQRIALQGEEKGYAETAGDASRRAASARARLEALSGLEEDLQGLPTGVRELVQAKEGGYELLLNQIQIPAPWDRLLENLLGRLQHSLWSADRPEQGFSINETLDFFFPSGEKKSPAPISGASPLQEMLTGDAACCAALCSRLGAVYTVATGAEGAALAHQHPHALFLSADGELHGASYRRTGMLTGEDSVGLMARRNARNAARIALQAAEAEYGQAHKLESGIHATLLETEAKISKLEKAYRVHLSEVERAEARSQEQLTRSQRAAEEISSLQEESRQLNEVLGIASAEETQATVDRDAAENSRLEKNEVLTSRQADAEQAQVVYEAVSSQFQEARVAFNRQEQTQEHLAQLAGEKEGHATRASAERLALEVSLDGMSKRIAEIHLEVEEAKSRRTDLLSRRAHVDERAEDANVQLQRASTALLSAREERSGEQSALDGLMENRQALALDEQKIRMQYEELVRGVHEEFHQDLEDLALSLQISPAAPIPDGLSKEAMHEEYGELRKKTEAIGSVNLDAVNELQDREERLSFLDRERTDLLEARGHLTQTLEELDAQCRQRFLETFEIVKENFEGIFRRLFRGGKGEIHLSPDMDPLEAGIEISARPPGKELRSINLLSGGERTLTALALLLAVFQSRPSPFCLLDEVDAALDDANVERFIEAIQDFTDSTQFMVVTHNRITMSRCERLFGVTMRKRGVSMLVSVDLADIPEFGEGAEVPDARNQALKRAAEQVEGEAAV